MVSMQDIAEKAGVSRSTVSIVLNNKADGYNNVRIPDSTRQRILEIAEELGYRPNQLARSIVSGKLRTIGYLVSEAQYEPHWGVITGALSEAENSDFTLKLLSVTDHTFEERVRQCVEMRLSGLIVHAIPDKTLLFEEARNARIPVVTVDESCEQPFGVRVAADDETGIRAALEHLTSLGHQRIALITSGFYRHLNTGSDIGTARERLFIQEMVRLGLDVPDGYIAYETMMVFGTARNPKANEEQCIHVTQSLLSHPKGRPTAILCWRDETAMVAIRGCHQAGLRVPEDISIIGFSDIRAARFSNPPLSTVKSPWDEMGRLAMRQICEHSFETLATKTTNHLVPSSFVARKSSGPAPTT